MAEHYICNEFTFELPASKRTVTLKVLNHRDEKKIEDDVKSSRKLNKLRGITNDVTVRLRNLIQSVDGDDSPKVIRDFVETERFFNE